MKHYILLIPVSLAFVLSRYTQPGNVPFANRYLSNLGSTTAVNVHLLPWKADDINLGSATKPWKNLYLAGNVYKGSDRFLSSDALGNTFLGILAGTSNKGSWNAAIGDSAMYSNTTGNNNTAAGYRALYSNTESEFNTAFGVITLSNTTAFGNSAFGAGALSFTTTGEFNTASGGAALFNNITGSYNVASGAFALVQNSTGAGNVAIGVSALESNHTTHDNTAIGGGAGGVSLDCSNSTFLGASTNADSGVKNTTVIGYQAHATASNQVIVGNSSVTSIGGYANWSNFSDGRYKKNVREDVPGLTFITQLGPVTSTLDVDGIENTKSPRMQRTSAISLPGLNNKMSFPAYALEKSKQLQLLNELEAKQEKASIIYTGFIAQEVEDAAKKLNYNFSGVDAPKSDKGFYALRYGDFVVPLVKAVQEQQKQIEEQQTQIDELRTLLQSLTKQSVSSTTNSRSSAAFLKQNAPNPFNKSTVIGYSIPENISDAQIAVTDMNGRLIKTFTITKGEGQINISSGELPAATYNLITRCSLMAKRLMLSR